MAGCKGPLGVQAFQNCTLDALASDGYKILGYNGFSSLERVVYCKIFHGRKNMKMHNWPLPPMSVPGDAMF